MSENFLEISRLENTISNKQKSCRRVIRYLFKKSFLIKIRKPATILEFLFACVVWVLIHPAWKLAVIDQIGELNPPINFTSLIPTKLFTFFAVTENSTLVVLPDCNNTRSLFSLINNTIYSFLPSNSTFNITFDPIYVNTIDEMKTTIYSQTSNGIGIYWKNAEESDALVSPEIQTYLQSFLINPTDEVFEILYRAIAVISGEERVSLALTNTSFQPYASQSTKKHLDLTIFLAIMVVLPIIISTMPELQTILEEKDNGVQTLSFLMGCDEPSYWFVSFVMQFILSFFPYFFLSMYLCFGGMMNGTPISFMMALSLLFIISHICFLMFTTTFLNKASMGRMLPVIFLVFEVFFAYLHFFFTLDDSNHIEGLKHLFSMIPVSSYQMMMMTMYTQARTSMAPITWKDVFSSNDSLKYQAWYLLLWLLIDSITYFILFVFFNLVNSRDFGFPPLSWKELFNKDAWRRLFKKKKNNFKFSSIDEPLLANNNSQKYMTSILLEVEGLSKTYYGYKTFQALDNVDFKIYQNEVIVIIGPNGAGKSTLINILSGAIEPTSGTVRLFNGPPIKRFQLLQDIIGVCFQDNVLVNLLSIKEHFELFGAFRDIHPTEIQETMMAYSDMLQLNEMLKTRACDLSGGQKRKLCIALSLLGDPPIVIMDEPTAGVDVQSRHLIWKTIAAQKHTTTIVTSHALEEAEAVSSRLFVVSNGQIPFRGTSTELRNQFKCGYNLRIDGNVSNGLAVVKKYYPNAHISADRPDTIEFQVSSNVPLIISEIEANKANLEIDSFSISVEQLEDVLLKLIQHDEASYLQ